jgi:hypothetical protein
MRKCLPRRLTPENLRQTFAVDRELLRFMKQTPDWEEQAGELRKRLDREGRGGIVTIGAKVYEGIPEIKGSR